MCGCGRDSSMWRTWPQNPLLKAAEVDLYLYPQDAVGPSWGRKQIPCLGRPGLPPVAAFPRQRVMALRGASGSHLITRGGRGCLSCRLKVLFIMKKM